MKNPPQNFYFDQRKSPRIINKNNRQIINLRPELEGEKLGKSLQAFLVDYSLGGCGLKFITQHTPRPKEFYQFEAATLAPQFQFIRGQVMWCQLLGDQTFRIGCKYMNIVK